MNKTKTMVVPFAILCVTISLFLSGCGGNSGSVTIIRVINQSRWVDNIDDAVRLWNSRNPDNKVKLDQLVIGYPQLKNKLMTACGAGKPPDLSIIDNVWLAEFAEAGHLAHLDELDSSWFENEYKKDFFKVFQQVEIINGHLCGVRNQTDMALLWYRKDWLAKEKIEPPTTWDDLVKICSHFKKESISNKYGSSQFPLAMPLGRKAGETLVYQLLPLFWSNGGGILENGKLILNSGHNEQTLEFLKELVEKYKIVSPEAITFEWNRASQLFATGKAVMAFGGSYEKRLIQEISGWTDEQFNEHVGYILIPAGPGGRQSTTAGGMCYTVYGKSPNKMLAFEILKLAVSPDILKKFLLATYQNPPRKSIAETLNEKVHPFLARTTEYLYRAKPRPSFPEYSRLSDLIQEMIENVVSDKTEPSAALKEASGEISKLMDKDE